MINTLQSHIAGRWIGHRVAQPLLSAVNGRPVASTHAEAIDFAEAVHHARTVGLPALLALDFQQRAERLKALAKYLMAHKETLYAVTAHTGATRADGWIDIEGGAGTLTAYSALGSNELPSGNLVHEGPAMPLGKNRGFAGTHILVPRGGVAVHLNAFNFPVWGLLDTVGTGLLIRSAKFPPVFDTNRRGPDIGKLPDFSRLIDPIRFASGFYVGIEEAASGHAWLNRYDGLASAIGTRAEHARGSAVPSAACRTRPVWRREARHNGFPASASRARGRLTHWRPRSIPA